MSEDELKKAQDEMMVRRAKAWLNDPNATPEQQMMAHLALRVQTIENRLLTVTEIEALVFKVIPKGLVKYGAKGLFALTVLVVIVILGAVGIETEKLVRWLLNWVR